MGVRKIPSMTAGLLLGMVAWALSAPLAVQRPDGRRGQVFRSGIELVQLAATVVSEDGQLVGDLRRDDFEVFEDGVRQEIVDFTRDRVPLSLGR